MGPMPPEFAAPSASMSYFQRITIFFSYLNPLSYYKTSPSKSHRSLSELQPSGADPGKIQANKKKTAKKQKKLGADSQQEEENLSAINFATSTPAKFGAEEKAMQMTMESMQSGSTGHSQKGKASETLEEAKQRDADERNVSLGEIDFSSENPRYLKKMEKEYRKQRLEAGDDPEEIEKIIKGQRKQKNSGQGKIRSPIPPGL